MGQNIPNKGIGIKKLFCRICKFYYFIIIGAIFIYAIVFWTFAPIEFDGAPFRQAHNQFQYPTKFTENVALSAGKRLYRQATHKP